MKLIYVFLIGGAVALSTGIYLSLNSETKQDGIQNSGAPLSANEKPELHGIAAKEDLKENVAALGNEVSRLRAEILALRSDMQAQKAASNKTPVQEQPNAQQNLTEMHAKEDNRIKKQGEVLEAGFQQQTTDPIWSEKTKNLVHDALANDNVTSKDIVDVECRNSMCRVELANDANSEGLKIEEFPMKIGQELPHIMANQVKESDGSTTTVLYLSKDGFALPKADN